MPNIRRLQGLLLASGRVVANEFAAVKPVPRGRIILYHGLNDTASSFRSTPIFNTLITGLQGQGFDVIVPSVTGEGTGTAQTSYLQGQFNADATGANQKAVILADFDTVKAGLPVDSAPLYLAGVSWGGVHVATIAGNRSGIAGFFMHLPALDPTALTEFSSYSLSTLKNWNTSTIAAISNIATRGWVSYSDGDTRVGNTSQPTFITAVGCEAKHYTTQPHETNATNVADIETFTAALPS